MSKYRQDDERLNLLKTGSHPAWKSFFDDNADPFLLFVMKYGKVQRDQAFELYQDAIIILHRNVTGEKLAAPLRSSLQTYLFGIGKNLCRRSGGSHVTFPTDLPDVPLNPFEEEDERRHNAALVINLLNRIGDKCREFLTLVFLDEVPSKDIIKDLNIPSEEAFRKRKHDCLKKMRGMIA